MVGNADTVALNVNNTVDGTNTLSIDGLPTLTILAHEASAQVSTVDVFVNGTEYTTVHVVEGGDGTINTIKTGTALIGQDGAISVYFPGAISEIVMYGTELTPADRNKIESYLALKYGITLTGTQAISYHNSVDTTIWDATTNAAYHNDVAGIGIDSGSALTQTTSSSINDDSIVTMIGTNVVSGSFLVWGNDGAVITYSTNVPSSYGYRLLRTWLAQETLEDVGTVDISFDLTALADMDTSGDFVLLTDSDGDFSDATEVTGATVSGNIVSFSGVNFNDGDFFTLVIPRTNNAPVANDDTATTNEDTEVVIDVLANDTDVDNNDALSIAEVNEAMSGTTAISGSMVTYTPDAEISGNDTFTYTVEDESGLTDVATVVITVIGTVMFISTPSFLEEHPQN